MEPSQLIKAAPEIAKIAVPTVAAIPFTGIVKRMLGPAADELAEMWRDQVRLYRWGRQIKCIEKAEKMAQEAGFSPKAVPPKILFPLLEGASMEDDDRLHTMWASLLANASSVKGKIVRPSFISLLREMAPDEAELLQLFSERWPRIVELEREMYRQLELIEGDEKWKQRIDLKKVFEKNEEDVFLEFRKRFTVIEGEDEEGHDARYLSCLKTLEDAGLIELESVVRGETYRLSGRGLIFIAACSPPKGKP